MFQSPSSCASQCLVLRVDRTLIHSSCFAHRTRTNLRAEDFHLDPGGCATIVFPCAHACICTPWCLPNGRRKTPADLAIDLPSPMTHNGSPFDVDGTESGPLRCAPHFSAASNLTLPPDMLYCTDRAGCSRPMMNLECLRIPGSRSLTGTSDSGPRSCRNWKDSLRRMTRVRHPREPDGRGLRNRIWNHWTAMGDVEDSHERETFWIAEKVGSQDRSIQARVKASMLSDKGFYPWPGICIGIEIRTSCQHHALLSAAGLSLLERWRDALRVLKFTKSEGSFRHGHPSEQQAFQTRRKQAYDSCSTDKLEAPIKTLEFDLTKHAGQLPIAKQNIFTAGVHHTFNTRASKLLESVQRFHHQIASGRAGLIWTLNSARLFIAAANATRSTTHTDAWRHERRQRDGGARHGWPSDFVPKPDNNESKSSAQGKPRLTLKNTSGSLRDGKSDTKPPHNAVPLYSSNIWSPNHNLPANSAGIPQKPSWDTFASTPNRAYHEPAAPTEHGISPLPGLGMQSGQTSFVRSADGRIIGANTGFNEDIGSFAHSDQYRSLGEPSSFPSPIHHSFSRMTDQLSQQPFGVTCQQPDSSFRQVDSDSKSLTQPGAVSNMAVTVKSNVENDAETVFNDRKSDSSGSHAVSDHFTMQVPAMAVTVVPLWSERSHPRSLRRGLKDPKAEWEEAFDGALTVLAAVNPEHFQMPLGTRIINVKSEFPSNVITAIRQGKLSVMAKVAERIMKIWDMRHDTNEKVLMLFSVNGSKKFCGLAEMSGPWDPDTPVEGWEVNPAASKPSCSSIPLTWIYIKDVSYFHFSHIRQQHNDHPVGNMWNGMNFEHHAFIPVGRAVVQQYVQTPATASILGHPKNYSENYELAKAGTSQQRRGTFSDRGDRGSRGGRGGGSFRGGSSFNVPFQRQRNAASDISDGDDSTPTAAKTSGRLPRNGSAPPKYNLAMLGNTKLAPGEIASVTVDSSGNLVLLPSPTGNSFEMDMPLTSRSFNSPRDFFQAAGRDSASLQHSASMNSMRAPGGPVLHPSVSMDSLTQQRGNRYPASSLISPAAHNTSFNLAQSFSGVPVSASMPSFSGITGSGSARALRTTPQAHVGNSHGGEDTPTHRPHSHLKRGATLPGLVTAAESGLGVVNIDKLKAHHHMLQAEKHLLQCQMQDPATGSMNMRLLNAKMNRLTLEIQDIEITLHRAGGSYSPERFDSSSEQGSVSSSLQNISPVRAADGRPLDSASMLGSPLSTTYGGYGSEAGTFQPRHRPSASWDLREKAVRDLVDSPKQDNKDLQPNVLSHQNSSFFPGGNGMGNAQSPNLKSANKKQLLHGQLDKLPFIANSISETCTSNDHTFAGMSLDVIPDKCTAYYFHLYSDTTAPNNGELAGSEAEKACRERNGMLVRIARKEAEYREGSVKMDTLVMYTNAVLGRTSDRKSLSKYLVSASSTIRCRAAAELSLTSKSMVSFPLLSSFLTPPAPR
ncbi:uncharacterized protein MYCFIDRAFT_173460 [Pseudocercospora fijiensis CIRAD86]|uniref:YTH domain-containing protein n=1 Tax=Pseudocercospora fijiensis (strain CIRAD86) TaxID=383855 RepID=M3B548_PSEFD|nr:uncharacterized protein MYCFIDRAFT_173460 [Pseudocercospora fijiensis CIRAD86]EME84477.1 hypothetical protein MYCFIDRAFT_173460 [Pseudocercospora fijiensis CIRAD86]